MREKNGSGRKLLNQPESGGHLAIHTSCFIPVRTGTAGPFFMSGMDVQRYKENILHILHLYIVDPCKQN